MLAPIDKVSRPNGNDIVQIVVCARCDRACSNCTQLLPFRKDYAFMSLDCFEEACISVKDWPGLVAMFGGNPAVHPHFTELCEIMSRHIAPEHRGLWTNNLFKHVEVAKKTFGKGRGRFNPGGLNLNAHADPEAAANLNRAFPGKVISASVDTPAKHASILVDYRDMGISDGDWPAIRESCDINRNWSGAIVERDGKPFAYFCEVAAAIDGIRGTNHGIPATPGWWKLRMDAFQHQVKACCDSGCGVPLRDQGALDTEEIYNVSESWRGRIEGKATLAPPVGTSTKSATDYMRSAK